MPKDMSKESNSNISPLALMPNRFLAFHGSREKRLTSSATLVNKTEKQYAFRIQTKAPAEKFSAIPNHGLIEPNETVTIKVTLSALEPGEKRRAYNFEVQAVEVNPPFIETVDAWSKNEQREVLIHELSTSFEDKPDTSPSKVYVPQQYSSKIPKFVRRPGSCDPLSVLQPKPILANKSEDHETKAGENISSRQRFQENSASMLISTEQSTITGLKSYQDKKLASSDNNSTILTTSECSSLAISEKFMTDPQKEVQSKSIRKFSSSACTPLTTSLQDDEFATLYKVADNKSNISEDKLENPVQECSKAFQTAGQKHNSTLNSSTSSTNPALSRIKKSGQENNAERLKQGQINKLADKTSLVGIFPYSEHSNVAASQTSGHKNDATGQTHIQEIKTFGKKSLLTDFFISTASSQKSTFDTTLTKEFISGPIPATQNLDLGKISTNKTPISKHFARKSLDDVTNRKSFKTEVDIKILGQVYGAITKPNAKVCEPKRNVQIMKQSQRKTSKFSSISANPDQAFEKMICPQVTQELCTNELSAQQRTCVSPAKQIKQRIRKCLANPEPMKTQEILTFSTKVLTKHDSSTNSSEAQTNTSRTEESTIPKLVKSPATSPAQADAPKTNLGMIPKLAKSPNTTQSPNKVPKMDHDTISQLGKSQTNIQAQSKASKTEGNTTSKLSTSPRLASAEFGTISKIPNTIKVQQKIRSSSTPEAKDLNKTTISLRATSTKEKEMIPKPNGTPDKTIFINRVAELQHNSLVNSSFDLSSISNCNSSIGQFGDQSFDSSICTKYPDNQKIDIFTTSGQNKMDATFDDQNSVLANAGDLDFSFICHDLSLIDIPDSRSFHQLNQSLVVKPEITKSSYSLDPMIKFLKLQNKDLGKDAESVSNATQNLSQVVDETHFLTACDDDLVSNLSSSNADINEVLQVGSLGNKIGRSGNEKSIMNKSYVEILDKAQELNHQPDPIVMIQKPATAADQVRPERVFGEDDILEASFNVWREAVFYAVAFLILGIILGKLGI